MINLKITARLQRVLKWIGWVVLAQFILLNISAALHAYKLTHFYTNSPVKKKNGSRNLFNNTWKLFAGTRITKSIITTSPPFPYETVKLKTHNIQDIEAWYSEVDSARGTVILFHGISSNKGVLIPEASEFRNSGYNVMLVDFRAHGNSGGSNCSMGFFETEEIQLASDFAARHSAKKIYLYGVSMGAVTILKSINDNLVKPAGVIIEMPFASLQHHIKARARTIGFPEQPFGFLVTAWIGFEQGYRGWNHKASEYAENVDCPVLFQWGVKDNFVQKSETDEIFKHLAADEKKNGLL